ncbi:cytochrome C oxidase subunit IV family protein [Mycolicibacterium baixiangningiae]|uniref:cytochrome C oxidase subunit IV family protein n=1 Tax=Mycolicibacterium baixiangningiae TaxID=2761578 RepID=UPI001867A206|nr:cytochrome C oxidase subunit IV family protein [Mycolicibacterium baixiangningiae]
MATTPAHPAAAQRAVTVVWLALAAITVVSWWLAPGHSGGPATTSVPITLAVAALAVVKGRLIIRYFMEVRHAPRWLQVSTDAWLIVLWAAVLGIYLY